MNDPFEDASSFHFSVQEDQIGEEFIDVYIDGYIHNYDKVHIILLGGAYPVVFGMLAVQDGEEESYVPADTFPLERVERIENPISDVERIG